MEEYEDDFENETPPATPGDGAVPPPIGVADLLEDTQSSQFGSPQTFPWRLITLDELDVSSKLAQGAMGAVHAGMYCGRSVAIKTLHDTSKAALGAVEAELLVHASLKNNRRVVELLGANLEPPGCCIVMEQCDCSVFELLHRRNDEVSRRRSIGIGIEVCVWHARTCIPCMYTHVHPHGARSASACRSPRAWRTCTRGGRRSCTAT